MTLIKSRKIGTLSAIAGLLICSAGLRIVGISSVAIAAVDQGGAPAIEPTMQKPSGENLDLDALLESFKVRETTLEAEEARLSERAEKIEKMHDALGAKLQELSDAEVALRGLLAIADSASEDDVAQLTTVYENMKPKNAAIVFEEMEPAFAAGFLARMRPDSAAAVMAGLKPKTAYAVSVVLAGRHSEISKK
jgi:flagellar motility protein MotE (MotC chaperone)